MAEAIIKGLLGQGVPADDITFFEPNAERREQIAKSYDLSPAPDNQTLTAGSDVIVLAIKPQLFDAVIKDITPGFSESKLLVSILAGVNTKRMQKALGGSPRVVRVMPNTPALIGFGAAALCPGEYASAEDKKTAEKLFSSVGAAVWVEEEDMDAVTGLSGSGPAYVYMFIEGMIAAGVQQGLAPAVARELAVQTVVGAAHMVGQTGEDPLVLREKVCSPGGTTIQGVQVLADREFMSAVKAAVDAATKRSRELGKN